MSNEAKENLIIQIKLAQDMIRVLNDLEQFPDLPIYVCRPGVQRALELPLGERKSALHIFRVMWEREEKRAAYFLDSINSQCGGNNDKL